MGYISIILGIYLIVMTFIITGKNTKSKLLFNVIPFFIGLYLLVIGVQQIGIITLNI